MGTFKPKPYTSSFFLRLNRLFSDMDSLFFSLSFSFPEPVAGALVVLLVAAPFLVSSFAAVGLLFSLVGLFPTLLGSISGPLPCR